MAKYQNLSDKLQALPQQPAELYGSDFLLTWQKSREALDYLLELADLLKHFRNRNVSPKVFDTGLAISIFRDQSTRTRFSFASAANLLGLAVQELDEKKSQVAHGETVRETATMISFLTDVIGIRDDIFLGEGHRYMEEVGEALDDSVRRGVLPERPHIVNLQSDIDHPTQSMADLLHLRNHFGSLEALAGKKIAVTWAYSPSYGKPLSVPQGIIGLMSRYGMNVTLSYPEGYHLSKEVTAMAENQAAATGGSFSIVNSMEEAFEDADIVYPKSWAPYHVMEERTSRLRAGDTKGLDALEKQCLAENARHRNWECNEAMMKRTAGGEALYMHCLPADISGVSCEDGEVSADVFEKYRIDTYHEAGYKPYIIAAMILSSKFREPASVLNQILEAKRPRKS
ncbi:MAG: knotted carbamoyltransferase YgeW [Bacteroidales bacterium]